MVPTPPRKTEAENLEPQTDTGRFIRRVEGTLQTHGEDIAVLKSESDQRRGFFSEFRKPAVWISTILLVCIIVGGWYGLKGQVSASAADLASHAKDCDIHHSTKDLDATYLRKDVSEAEFSAIRADLRDIKQALGVRDGKSGGNP